MTAKQEMARAYFRQGYNCAQAVFAAFAKEMAIEEKEALRMSSSLGGGMGGLREVCGAVSAMFLAAGALKGYDMPDDSAAKQRHYQRIQQMADVMKAEYGSINCRELLERNNIRPDAAPADRDEAYYATRPCARYVEFCVKILEQELAKED